MSYVKIHDIIESGFCKHISKNPVIVKIPIDFCFKKPDFDNYEICFSDNRGVKYFTMQDNINHISYLVNGVVRGVL